MGQGQSSMPTTYMDQFWTLDPYAPPPPGTVLNVSFFSIVDQNDNNLINRFANDSIDGQDIKQSYPGDTVTVQLSNGTQQTITGATFYLADGRQVFTPIDGSTLSNATLVSTTWVSGQNSVPVSSLGPPCFTPGTLIETENGPRPVEELERGDLVATADRGLVPIRLVHRRAFSAQYLRNKPKHGPVLIRARSLGCGLPERDLLVSPQHRMLIKSLVARRMFGDEEVLAPACQLAGQPGISRVSPPEGVEYIHILLDHHAIIFAEGAPTETLFLGEQMHENLTQREVDWIWANLPYGKGEEMKPARQFVRGRRFRRMLERHEANAKPLLNTRLEPKKFRARPRLRLVG